MHAENGYCACLWFPSLSHFFHSLSQIFFRKLYVVNIQHFSLRKLRKIRVPNNFQKCCMMTTFCSTQTYVQKCKGRAHTRKVIIQISAFGALFWRCVCFVCHTT